MNRYLGLFFAILKISFRDFLTQQTDKMADKTDGKGKPMAEVKIGHYILGDTLGVGTFGKVKSKNSTIFLSQSEIQTLYEFYKCSVLTL